jgi:hypothetical protein
MLFQRAVVLAPDAWKGEGGPGAVAPTWPRTCAPGDARKAQEHRQQRPDSQRDFARPSTSRRGFAGTPAAHWQPFFAGAMPTSTCAAALNRESEGELERIVRSRIGDV